MMADCLTLLLQGDILTGITCPFTNVIGLYFYAIMIMTFEVVLILKYDEISVPATVGIFYGFLMLALLPPEAWRIPLGILVFNLAVVLYSMYRMRD